jgi:phage tail-like protein
MPIQGVTKTFHKKFKFVVEIQGVASAAFRSCGEISAEVGVVEQREGGALIPDATPGLVTVPEVELKRGVSDDLDLYLWFQQIVGVGALLEDPEYKRPVSIVQQNRLGLEIKRWVLWQAWPKKFVASEGWDNEANENVIESVTFRYDYFVLGGA